MASLEGLQGQIYVQNEKIDGIVSNITTYNNLTKDRCAEITKANLDTHKEIWGAIKELKQTSNRMIGGILVISALWSIPIVYILNKLIGI